MPARVVRQLGVDAERNDAEVGGGELPLAGVAVWVAERLELLEVGDLLDVDLLREVLADRVLERLARLEVAAREGPVAGVGFFRALPEQHLKAPVANLEDSRQRHLRGCFRFRSGNSAKLVH